MTFFFPADVQILIAIFFGSLAIGYDVGRRLRISAYFAAMVTCVPMVVAWAFVHFIIEIQVYHIRQLLQLL